MIIYGFLNYAYYAKTRKWRGARTSINAAVGSGAAPDWMVKLATGMDQYTASALCIRSVEAILGLPNKSITWKFTHLSSVEAKLVSQESGIYDPNYQAGHSPSGGQEDRKGLAYNVPPFNSQYATVCSINLEKLDNVINLRDPQNKVHKAYLMILLGSLMALGDRLFFESAAHPDTFPPSYDERELIKTVLNKTKFHVGKITGTTTKVKYYMNCNAYDITNEIIMGYNSFLRNHPSLHIDDVNKLAQSVNQFTKVMRLAK